MKKLLNAATKKLISLGVRKEEINSEFASYGELAEDMFKTIINDDNYAFELVKILTR